MNYSSHSIFDTTPFAEKGVGEWSLFRAIRGDKVSIINVSSPRKATEPRYPNIIPIKRYRMA